ncbi:hypothetical protein [Marinospirillum sp.]|uniref:hypothetical protein n=1 Tax=Marinospirillum sp. TaxID=2183934 RepID=UPI003A8B263C
MPATSTPLDQVKADLLDIFKNIKEEERRSLDAYRSQRWRKARQSIEEKNEAERLKQELSDGWEEEAGPRHH